MNTDLLKNADIGVIAEKGSKIYEGVKAQYEPQHNGKFLAIDIDSENTYLGDSSAAALELARAAHPEKIFYVVRIGFETAEAMAHALTQGSY